MSAVRDLLPVLIAGLEDVTDGTKTSRPAPPTSPLRCAAESVPPMPVEEWQAAQLARYSSAPRDSDGGFGDRCGTGGPAWPSVAR